MKIAILMSGLVRDFKEASKSFRYAFQNHNYDVYMHTWQLSERSLNTTSKLNGHALNKVEPNVREIQQAFNPLKIQIDEQVLSEIPHLRNEFKHRHDYLGIAAPLCKYESMRRCFDLIENPAQYDCFFITRPDVIYFQQVTLPNVLENSTIYVPYVRNFHQGKRILAKMQSKYPETFIDIIHDFIAFGTYENISLYKNIGKQYIEVSERYPIKNGYLYYPERAIAIYLKMFEKKNIVEFQLKHGLQRAGRVQIYSD